MEQVHAHFNVAMAEQQSGMSPISTFRHALEEHRYNIFLLEQHRLAEGQIDIECTSKEVVSAMAAANANFIAEQRAIYESACAQAAAR
ncbi:hypothetical protein D1007_62476 [Hordeum vulgare]|nr:hypothetical protein D1007_62476 [Hordeum vulgare]